MVDDPVPSQSLSNSSGVLDEVLDTLFEGVYFVDRDRVIQKWNSGASRLTGFDLAEVKNRGCADNILVHVDENGTELCKHDCPLLSTMLDGQIREARLFLRHKHGYRIPVQVRVAPIRDSSGNIIGGVETFRETSDAENWNSRLAELEKAAFADALTGVPNRRYVEMQLARLLREHETSQRLFTLCILDLDHFKSVNDGYGHQAGDAVLATVSRTLKNCLRSTDVLGRWGGDEFVMLLPQTDRDSAHALMERCRALVESTITPFQQRQVRISLTLGAATVRTGESAAQLLSRADAQLYRAKQLGGNRCAAD